MAIDIRIKIMKDWHKHGQNAINRENPFEAFIYLWIAWVIGCKCYNANNFGGKEEKTEKELLSDWCKSDIPLFCEILEDNRASLEPLKNRFVGINRHPIINCFNNKYRLESMVRFSKYLNNLHVYENPHEQIKDFLSLIGTVRNNLFHGNKAYNDKSDRELLSALLPTILDLTGECINQYS